MNLWDQILARVETKVNRHSFYTWFKPTTFVAEGRGSLIVRVPNDVFKDWLTKHYSGVIGEAMSDLKKADLAVNFVADSPADGTTIPLSPDETLAAGPSPAAQDLGRSDRSLRSTARRGLQVADNHRRCRTPVRAQ